VVYALALLASLLGLVALAAGSRAQHARNLRRLARSIYLLELKLELNEEGKHIGAFGRAVASGLWARQMSGAARNYTAGVSP
jgi:hypothetical protein